jgi:hypothetical protein
MGEIPLGEGDTAETLRRAANITLQWLRSKFPSELPQAAWDCGSFDIEEPGQKIECVGIEELGLWTARLTQPDVPFRDRAAVAGRTWITDVALSARETAVGIGMRVTCASLPFCDDEIALTRPRVLIDIAANLGLRTQRTLDGRPWQLDSDADLDAFRDLLNYPLRSLPVMLLTQPDRRRLRVQVSDYVLDPVYLARRTQGVAHVVLMPWDLGFTWTDQVGKPWSAYLGAVRTYYPGLDFDEQPPSSHPRTLAEDILFWRYAGIQGESAFTEFLIHQAMRHAAGRRIEWSDLLFINDARTKRAELARKMSTEERDWRKLYDEEIAGLKGQIKELNELNEGLSDDSIAATKAKDRAEVENTRLRAQLDGLRTALAQKTGQDPDESIPIPQTYNNFADWVEQHLTGRLVLHPRALRGMKDACYENVGLVYQAMLLLGKEYRDMKLGFDGSKGAFDAKRETLELRLDQSITESRAGQQGEQYYVRFPPDTADKRFLELHLRKGTSKDPRFCLAIYFFWDDDTRQVVVGWMPSHLDNRMT